MFKIIIESLNQGNHVDLLKQLRLLSTHNMADAKHLAAYLESSLPCTLVAGIDRERADQIVSVIMRLGGAARAEHTDIDKPMLLCPSITAQHEMTFWGFKEVALLPA